MIRFTFQRKSFNYAIICYSFLIKQPILNIFKIYISTNKTTKRLFSIIVFLVLITLFFTDKLNSRQSRETVSEEF